MKKLLFLLVLMSLPSSAQKIESVDLRTPKSTLYTHIYFLQPNSYFPKKAAKTIYGVDEKEGVRAAIRLKKILDGKGLQLDFTKIPNTQNYIDSINFASEAKYVPFPVRMPLIYVEKIDGSWYYSQETIEKIDELYSDVFPWYIEKIQSISPEYGHKTIFGIEIWQVIMILVLLVAAFLVFAITKKIAFFILQRLLHRFTKDRLSEVNKGLKKLAHPISLLVALALIDKVFPSLQMGLFVNKWVFLGINIARTVFWIYVFLKLAQVVVSIYQEFTKKTHGKLDDQLVPILRNFLNGIIIFFGVIKIITFFGVNPTTILAGASIGGLAIAFASQDTVKNLIGTFMIFLDKPFHIGDWIEAGEVLGTVEEVGFRSTRVRAADTSVFQIPNSKLSEMVINNKGLRLYRRYKTDLGVRYDTPPELIEAFVKGIRDIIIEHPDTRSEPDSYNVEFTGFGDSALLIMVNVYFKSLAWGVEQSSKHRLHIAIVKLAKALGVDFAFPSTTVMIEQFPEKKSLALKYSTDPKRIDEALTQVLEDFKKEIAEDENN